MNWLDELNEKVSELKCSQRVLAKRLNIPHSYLNDVLKGKKAMNIKMALSLEYMFIGTAEYWLKLQLSDRLIKEKAIDGRF